MRALLIAPHASELDAQREEVQDIVNSGLDVELLQGDVSTPDVIRACNRDSYDVLWFSGHSSRMGVQLTTGTMRPEQLVSAVLAADAILVVLNSCESVSLANKIANETKASVVAAINDVADSRAYAVGATFARWLAKTGDVVRAYQMARPSADSNYIFIPSTNFMGYSPRDERQRDYGDIVRRVEALEKQLFEYKVVTDAAIRELQKQVNNGNPFSTSKPQFWLVILLLMFLSITTFTAIWLLSGGGVSP